MFWDAVVITGSSCGGGAERYFDGGPVLGAWILVNDRLQEEGRCFECVYCVILH